MPKNEREFVTYLSKHFRMVEAICARQIGFESSDELVAFLASQMDEPALAVRRANRLKDVGVLVQGAAGWMPPPFLVKFIRELRQRHVLASPEIVRGWIHQLDDFTKQLVREIEAIKTSVVSPDVDRVLALLHDIDYTFGEIVRIVHVNCERIALEVAEYRTTENLAQIKRRLNRLIELHDEYLWPLIQLVDINGSFYDVADKIAHACGQLTSHELSTPDSIRRQATSVRQLVVWLRMVVIRQAEEANRELAPLCLAAAQEHKIAKGVNRALEFARLGKWGELGIPSELQIIDDKNGPLFSDLAIERYLIDVQVFEQQPPPIVSMERPVELKADVTAVELVEQLDMDGGTDDLLDWVLGVNDKMELEKAIQLVHDAIVLKPEHAEPTDETKTYARNHFEADAHRWIWRTDENDDNSGTNYPDAPTTGRSVSAA